MVLFRIYGERNSGTNFLQQILENNKFPTCGQEIIENTVYNWKHTVPSVHYKKLDTKVVDLFIFRNLDDWLVSFFKYPYHLKKHKNFNNFLTLPQISNDEKFLDYRTNQCVNEDDNGKTIFQIRETKFLQLMEYKRKHNDVILVNLSFIQNEQNLSQFLDFVSDKYIPELKVNNYICSIKHTKCNSYRKNRNHKININRYRDIIDSKLNKGIENFINKLTFI